MKKSRSPLSVPGPKQSLGMPSKSGGRVKSMQARSVEDIPKALSRLSDEKELAPASKSRGSSPATGAAVAGIRYITETLIKKIAKEENVEQITSLNLMLSKEGGKKIKYIENLEKLKKLQSLNLSCNVIEKIEKVDRLSKLRELNLSFNCISRLDGLETLVNLQLLNVSGNNIEHIPAWFAKKMRALRTLRIAKNKLASLAECSKLKSLPNLSQLSVSENPISDLPHVRLYLIFHLRSLESLDGQIVSDEERKETESRFEQEEVENLERQIAEGEHRYKKLEQDHNKSVHELQEREITEQERKKREAFNDEKIQELERELTTKNDLLRKKTTELTKACEKHYQLEQELAFYKIDSKFETLGHRPELTDLDDSGNLDESPYIGRARYKANRHSHEGVISATPQQAQLHQREAANVSAPSMHPDVRDEMNKTLDREIADKQKAIERAQSRLERLQADLGQTEQQVLAAVQELKRVRDLQPYTEHTEQEKQKLRQMLAKKMQKVNQLRDAAAQVEDDMGRVQTSTRQTQSDLNHLKGRLQNMDPSHPEYRKTYSEMVDKEQQINESSQLFNQLQQQLEDMLEAIAKETTEIRNMERKLNEDKISQNDDLQEELGGIVQGLQSYLQSMKDQSKQQQQELQELLSHKEALEGKIRILENDMSVRDIDQSDYLEMKSRLAELEDSLMEHREQNDLLQDQLQSVPHDPEIQDRIEMAETEIKGLRKALKDAQKKAEQDRLNLERELFEERERAQEGLSNLPGANDKEGSVKRLTQQLEAIKALNRSLKDEMEDQRMQLEQQLNESIPPEELRLRLEQLAAVVTKGRALVQPENRDDFVGKTFRNIQKFVKDKMDTSLKDTERLKNEKAQLDAETQSLRQKIQNLQGQVTDGTKDKRDNYMAKLEAARKKDADQIRQLEEELKKLGKALRDAHTKSKEVAMASQTDGHTQLVYQPDKDTETEGSSLNTEERDLLDELQRELMELRNTMHNKEIEQSKQLADAETEATTRDNNFQQQQEAFYRDMERQRKELELERGRQEARTHVMENDLAQAHNDASALQQMLEEKTYNLHHMGPGSDMTNQMISAQEEEIAHLYDILERQRGEIDRLNGALHHVSDQGPEQYGPGYEEEMLRLRDEVNRLKETLSMQSQYVQSMPQNPSNARPPGVTMGTQSRFNPPSHAVPSFRQPIPQPPYQHQESVNQARVRGEQARPLYPQSSSQGQRSSQGHHTGYQGNFAGGDMPDGVSNQNPANRQGQPMGEHVSEPRGPGHHFTDQQQHRTPGQLESVQASKSTESAPLHSTPTSERTRPGHMDDQPNGQNGQFVDHLETRTPWGRYGGTTRGRTTFTDRHESKASSPPRSKVRPDQSEADPNSEMREQYVPQNQSSRTASAPYRPSGVTFRDDVNDAAPTGMAETYQPEANDANFYDPAQYYINPYAVNTDVHDDLSGIAPALGPKGNHLQPTPEISPIRPIPIQGTSLTPHGNRHPIHGVIPQDFRPFQQQQHFMPQNDRGDMPQTHAPVQLPYQYGAPHPQSVPQPPHHIPHESQQPTRDLPVHESQRAMTRQNQPIPSNMVPVFIPAHPGQESSVPVPSGGSRSGVMPLASTSGQPVYIPVTPIYSANPFNDAVTQTEVLPPSNQPHAVLLPISPIRSTTNVKKMETGPRRGILKRPEEMEEGSEESYLYCNVPEHHELEDHIASLQEKIKELKALLNTKQTRRGSISDVEETRLIRRLIAELEDRRSDLEGLDLAIERQKKGMRKMKKDERNLLLDKSTAEEELSMMKIKNQRIAKKKKLLDQFDSDTDDDFDYREAKKKQKHLQNEIQCLEKTLLKRSAELRESDRLLKECNENLKDARFQARDTVRRYDQASVGLQNTVRDAVEIEKRANDAGVELLKVSDQLVILKTEVRDLDRKKTQQERLLKEINAIIAKKDKEFREVDARNNQANLNSQQIQAELTAAQHREREVMSTLKESEDVLGKRRHELNRLREQIENQRSELEKVDQEMGRKKTELKLLEETLQRKQSELNSVLREAETEVTNKQRELKDHWEQAKTLESHNTDLTSSVKVKRAELHQLRSDLNQENEVMEKILSAVNKQKAELKHTYEMQKLEQTELESLKSQHNQKLSELEKTQSALLDERAELERLTTETNRKTGELDRLRQSLDHERAELDRVTMEKRGLEERITTLSRDRDLLEENSKSVDNKLNNMKRTCKTLEDKMESGSRRVELLDEEMQIRETEVEKLNVQRTILQKDVSSLKQILDTGHCELKDLKEQVSDTEDQAHTLEQDLLQMRHQRDSLTSEIADLESLARESRISHDLCLEKESEKERELQELARKLQSRREEYQEAMGLLSSSNMDLNRIQDELTEKESELTRVINNINKLKKETETLGINAEKFAELQKEIKELRQELVERNREKNELSYALTRSYEQVQKLRSESSQEREKMVADQLHLEGLIRDLKRQLDHTQQELVNQQRKTESQVIELESLAQEHIRRANQLNRDITSKGGQSVVVKHQTQNTSFDFIDHHLSMLQIDKLEARKLPKENKENERVFDEGPVREEWRREALKEKLIEEQDHLRQQLRQQMSRHSEAMETVRLQSEGTLDSLRRKLNNLQDVLISSSQPSESLRSRSPESKLGQRSYSRSPIRNESSRSYSAQRHRSRSPEKLGQRSMMSGNGLRSPIFPEKDIQ